MLACFLALTMLFSTMSTVVLAEETAEHSDVIASVEAVALNGTEHTFAVQFNGKEPVESYLTANADSPWKMNVFFTANKDITFSADNYFSVENPKYGTFFDPVVTFPKSGNTIEYKAGEKIKVLDYYWEAFMGSNSSQAYDDLFNDSYAGSWSEGLTVGFKLDEIDPELFAEISLEIYQIAKIDGVNQDVNHITLASQSFGEKSVPVVELWREASLFRSGELVLVDSFTSLEAALAKAEDGDTIKVIKDFEIKEQVDIYKEITLDLNGKNITSAYQADYPADSASPKHIYPFRVYGELTVTDSMETGSISGRGILVSDGSKITVEAGSIYAIDSNGGSAIYMYGGEVVVNGGHIEQNAPGTYNFAVNANAGKVTVNGGWIGGNHGAIASGGAEVVLNDGKFVCTGTPGMTDNVLYTYNSGTITINNGTFIADSDTPAGGCCIYDANGSVVVNNGNFSNSSGGDVWGTTGTTIKGGNFENLIETTHVVEGATIVNGGKTMVKTEGSLKEAVAVINGTIYSTFDEALEVAKSLTGDVTVEILGKVSLKTSIGGSFDSIKFVGKNDNAEIYMDIQGYIEAPGKKVAFEDLKLSKVAGGYVANAGFMNLAFGIYGADSVSYEDCVFVNGAYSSGDTTFEGCTFYRSHDRYGLWVYGNTTCVVDECTFDDIRGIKVYHEGKEKTADLTVKNTVFTDNVNNKPAIVLTNGKSVTLENNTYSSTGVFELDLDGNPNGTVVTSDVAPTCKNDNGACGVLVDGKIYTTVADAAEVAEKGSEVTLLHNSTETVELPKGVILDKNGFTADGVTVETPVATIGTTEYKTIAAAINAAQNGDVVTILPGEYSAINISNKNITVQGTVGANGELLTTIKGGNPAITAHGFNGTIKDIKIVDAFTAMYAEPAGNVTVDNVYVEGATYGFHLIAYSKGLTWTFQNSYMDLGWANSLGVYGDGYADVIFKNNRFESTNPYYPDYGALAVNTFLPSLTVENNIFGEGAKIMIRETVTDTSKISIANNYHEDGVENAFVSDSPVTVPVYLYYTEVDSEGNLAGFVDAREAEINGVKYITLEEAFAAAQEGETITLLTDATPALTSQRAITKAAVIDLNGKTLTLTEDDLYFGTTTFKNGNIVVDPSVKASTAVFWMFKNQTLTFEDVKLTATGVSGTYLIGLEGDQSNLNLKGSEIIVENDTALDLDIICVNSDGDNYIVVDNTDVKVSNLDGRVFFRGNYTISGDSEINLSGITKAGFRIEANQTLAITDNAKVTVTGEPRDGGIHIAGGNVTYTVADTAEVNATVKSDAVATIGNVHYASLQAAFDAVNDGETITLLKDITITKDTAYVLNGYYEGAYYEGDNSFVVDLNGKKITNDSAVNDYLLLFKNVGGSENEITFKNGTIEAASSAFCAICTSTTSENTITINLEDVTLINNNSNGATAKIRGGAVLNVKDGTVIKGLNSYTGIECVASTVNIYDGAEIYQNGTASYVGALAGVSGKGTLNVYGGYGKSAKCGFIAMTSGGTINVHGGEWIANKNGSIGDDSNSNVLTAQNNKYEGGYAGASIINVTGGIFHGGMDAWILNDATVEKAELNISGGNFNANPGTYVEAGYKSAGTKEGRYIVYPEFTVEAIADCEKAEAGQTITVQVKVKGGNYTNAEWTLKYDPKYVTYTGTDDKNYKISGKVVDGAPNDGYDELDADYVLGTYTFTVNELTKEAVAVFEIVNAYVHNYEMSANFDGVEAKGQPDSVAIVFKTAEREIETKTVVYNGMEQRGNGVTDAPANAIITYSTTNDFTNGTQIPPAFVDAGTYTYYAQIKLDGYATKVVEGTLVIEKDTVEPSVEWMVAPESNKVEFIPVIKGVVDDSYKNKGGKVTVTGQKADGTAFTFEFNADEFAYDGHGKAIYTGAATEISGIKGDEELEVTVNYTAGTNANYADGVATASVHVNKSTIDDAMENKLAAFIEGNGEVVYDGQAHFVTVDDLGLEALNWTAEVANHNGVTKYGDVEVVDVTFTDKTGKYNDYTATVMIKVVRRNVTIHVNNATKKNGQLDSKANGWGYITTTSNGTDPAIINNELGEIKVVRANGQTGEVEGTYAITATYTPNDNYIVNVENGTLTIADAVFVVEVVDNAHNGNEITYGADTKSDYTTGSVANGNHATKMILVHTDSDYAFFTFKGEKMYDVTEAGYEYVDHNYADNTHTNKGKYQHVYAIVVDAEYGDVTSEAIEAMYARHIAYAGKDATAAYAPVKVTYDADINNKDELHANDYSTVKGVYSGIYNNRLYQISILKADYTKDKIVNTADAIAVKAVVVGK